MSTAAFFEIFGGIGAVVLGVGGCMWKYLRSFEFKHDYISEDKEDPVNVLSSTWENVKEEDNCEEQKSPYNLNVLTKKKDGKWVVNIKKNGGSIYIYKTYDKEPEWEYNKKSHYLRINVKNKPNKDVIEFHHKYFDSDWKQLKETKKKKIKHNGENVFETKSLIVEENVHYEQLGIYVNSTEAEIKDLVIEEAYYGEKWNFWNIFCCGKHVKTLLYRKIEASE